MALNNTYIGSPDDRRTTAIVAYITFIGWLISYFFLSPKDRTALSAYHLRQSLLIHILSFLLKIAYSFTLGPGWAVFAFIVLLALVLFFIWLKSFINAMNAREAPAPLIGRAAERLFSGLR
jgi:uncharacterized membrane protein